MAAYRRKWAKNPILGQKIRPIRVRIGLIWSQQLQELQKEKKYGFSYYYVIGTFLFLETKNAIFVNILHQKVYR